MGLTAQTYNTWWKQVEEAQQKDLPQTALAHLEKIEKKAQKERSYGQLLKSTLLHARLQSEVSPDSLSPAVSRIEQQLQAADTPALRAVYATVLASIYASSPKLGDDYMTRSKEYRQQAMSQPDVLARTKAGSFAPFVTDGKSSDAFGDDLLSVVGMELGEWQWLKDYYTQAGNRRALCHLALQSAHDLPALDSLAVLYGDLPEADVIAKRRANVWKQQTFSLYLVDIPERVAIPGEPQTVRLHHLRNIRQLTLRVWRTNLKGDTTLNPDDPQDYARLRQHLEEVTTHRQTLTFAAHGEQEVFNDSLQLQGLPAGIYLIECSSPQAETTRMLYYVSALRVIAQPLPQDRMRYVVVDARSGQPQDGAKLRMVYRRGWNKDNKTEHHTCDRQGEVVVDFGQQRPSEVYAYTVSDNYSPSVSAYGRYSFYERTLQARRISLFTDRSIYRPGQTVHAVAIAWREVDNLNNTAIADLPLKIELRDANHKLVAEKQVTTDRYGKCSTRFTLPTHLLGGLFTIRTEGAGTSFSVEEYKRPAFHVEFEEYKQAYQAGDTVSTQAKVLTYSDVPVQQARVHYTVRRRVAFWWMNYSRYRHDSYVGNGLEETVVAEGDTTTSDDGAFSVTVPLLLPDDLKDRPMFYHFVIDADVTDVAGETHHAATTLPLGTKPTALTCDLPRQVRSDQLPPVTFTRRNAAGQEIDGNVSYRIDNGPWQQCAANAQCSMVFATPHARRENGQRSMPSGQHRLEAICGTDTISVSFVVFSLSDKVPAAPTHDWFYVSATEFPADGSPVTLQVGASDPDLHIVYSLFAGDKVVESGAIERDAALLNRQFTYKEEYGNGLLLAYAWVKDGHCYQHTQFISRPVPDKRLKMTWQTFRDRLTPGQQEEWRLKIVRPDGTPAEASLLAVLYDKSLDQLKPHQWSLNPDRVLPRPSATWMWRSWGNISLYGAEQYRLKEIPPFVYRQFDHSVYPYYHSIYIRGTRRLYAAASAPMMENKRAIGALDVRGNDEAADEVLMAKETGAQPVADQATADSAQPAAGQSANAVQLRENLNETAFCYPALETDAQGEVTLRFTLPESLTTWRFMGVANTTDMLTGAIDGETVARKDVMVQPNMPRFVRMGDEAQLSARIFNTSDHAVSGQTRLELVDPATNAVIAEQQQPFAVEAAQTAAVTFQLPLNGTMPSLLICRITAEGDGFSDGEQHYLPLLPDREYVTRTIPFTQHAAGVKSIDLTTLFPQGTTQQKLTVEYTHDPAWLVVQSLPVVGQPWEHSAIELAAAYYSNRLAKTLTDRNPQIKATFEQWKRDEAANPSPLTSNLYNNQELKDIVLSETPWVAAADRDSEQKQRLADFFDDNGLSNRLGTTLDKLKKLQRGDGSFTWYPGMEGSNAITVAVGEMMVRLNHMTGQQDDTRDLLTKAFGYMGRQMTDLVDRMKKEEKKGHKPSFPSFTALRWLYLCALDGRQLPADVQRANDYLTVLLKKDIKRQSIYEKALTAVVLARHGETRRAAEYVQSLKEYSVCTEEMGRYYDTPRANYSWYDYKIPTEVAAIEAIRLVTPDDRQTVNEMRRWLLQEKRTQTWDTPINTVNAIWAFMETAPGIAAEKTGEVTLAIDGEALPLPQATAGLGYVKTAVSTPQGSTFTATKTSEGTSWGAVYAQFLQTTAAIEASQGGITVRREFMVNGLRNATRSEKEWSTVNGQWPTFREGQRIKVRITIDTTRDLDFVQVCDRRAACMEPVRQLSGYHQGAYVSPKDCATYYYFGQLAKGRHIVETEYYIDRAGCYQTGTCTAQCAYAPEYRATAPSLTIEVKE